MMRLEDDGTITYDGEYFVVDLGKAEKTDEIDRAVYFVNQTFIGGERTIQIVFGKLSNIKVQWTVKNEVKVTCCVMSEDNRTYDNICLFTLGDTKEEAVRLFYNQEKKQLEEIIKEMKR